MLYVKNSNCSIFRRVKWEKRDCLQNTNRQQSCMGREKKNVWMGFPDYQGNPKLCGFVILIYEIARCGSGRQRALGTLQPRPGLVRPGRALVAPAARRAAAASSTCALLLRTASRRRRQSKWLQLHSVTSSHPSGFSGRQGTCVHILGTSVPSPAS